MTNEQMTSTSTSTNEHYDKALEILNTAPRYRLDGPGDPHMPGLAIDTLEHHIRAMAAQADRWKRLALAYESHEDALLYGSAADQENAREEARAARDALITSGDLPADRLHERGLVPGTQTVDAVIDHAAAMAQQLADVQEVCRNLSEAEREYEAEHGAMAARIEALEARNGLLETLYRAVEENGGYNDMHDDVWAAMDALMHDDMPNGGSNGR